MYILHLPFWNKRYNKQRQERFKFCFGAIKKNFTHRIAIFYHPYPMSQFTIFTRFLSLMSFTKKWQTIEEEVKFSSYKLLQIIITLCRRKPKRSHTRVEILFKVGNISETRAAFWMCFSCFSTILSETYEIQSRRNFAKEI